MGEVFYKDKILGVPLTIYWSAVTWFSLPITICYFFHELGHLIVAILTGLKPNRMELHQDGGSIGSDVIADEKNFPYIGFFLTVIAGPIATIILIATMLVLSYLYETWLLMPLVWHQSTILYGNLMPFMWGDYTDGSFIYRVLFARKRPYIHEPYLLVFGFVFTIIISILAAIFIHFLSPILGLYVITHMGCSQEADKFMKWQMEANKYKRLKKRMK